MNLSEHFTLSEFINSQTASRLGIPNDPPVNLLLAIKSTAAGLEQVRSLLGNKPILISSAYRCPALNDAVHGQRASQHLLGEAADITCPAFGDVLKVMKTIATSTIPYDQLIQEFGYDGWVHISFSERNRRQALVIDSKGTRPYYA